MTEQSFNPIAEDPLSQLRRQVEGLAVRLGRVEQRLGMAAEPATLARPPHRPAGTPPPPAAAPAQPAPPAAATPPPAFDLPWTQEATRRPEPVAGPRAAVSEAGGTAVPGQPSPGVSQAERPRTPTATADLTRHEPRRDSRQWEALIGGKWALWLGSVAVLFALAFFLAAAWQSLGNAGRLAVGTLIGASFLVAGGWARGRAESWFSEGLTGGGLGILYLSIWAGAQRYQLLSFDTAFTLMALTTAMGVWLAVRYDAVGLTTLATLGGFLTPVLLRSTGGGGGQSVSFLVYVALLNAGILGVSLWKRWRGVIWLSFGATLVLMLGWAATSYTGSQRWLVFSFITLYFLLFVGTACFHSLIRREETAPQDLLLLFASAMVYFPTGQGLLREPMGSYPGLFPVALALFFALAALATRRLAPENRTLAAGQGALGLLFLTLAIPIQLRQGAITIAFSLEAAILLTLGLRLRAPLLRRAGQIVWGLALLCLTMVLLAIEPVRRSLFLNERALPLLAYAAASAWMAVTAHWLNRAAEQGETAGCRDELSPLYAVAAVFAGAWLIAQETFLGFRWWDAAGMAWQARATFVTACLWSVYAVAVCAAGWRLRMPAVRLCAFLVAAFAAVLPVLAGMDLRGAGWTPFWNLRWLSYVVVALALAALLRMIAREREHEEPTDAEALGVLPVLISLLVLCGLSVELYSGFGWYGASWASWNVAAAFGLATLWSVFALVVLAVGLAWGHRALRILAYLVGGAGAALLLLTSLNASGLPWAPVLNLRVLAFAVVIGMLTLVPSLLRRRADELPAADRQLMQSTQLLLLTLVLAVWGLTQETYETFRYFQYALGPQWERAAQMGISLVWTVCGVLLLIGGVVRQRQPVRLLALALCGMTALKVFLFDLASLKDTPLRILSFGGLGLALIGISWLYTRYGIGKDDPVASGR